MTVLCDCDSNNLGKDLFWQTVDWGDYDLGEEIVVKECGALYIVILDWIHKSAKPGVKVFGSGQAAARPVSTVLNFPKLHYELLGTELRAQISFPPLANFFSY